MADQGLLSVPGQGDVPLEAVRSCCCHLPCSYSCQQACKLLFLREPAGSCLTSAELIQSSACFLPLLGPFGASLSVMPDREAPSRQPSRALACGACTLAMAASGLHPAPSVPRPAVSLWLLAQAQQGVSGPLLAPRLSREGGHISSSWQSSACGVASSHLATYSWGQQSLLLSSRTTKTYTHTHSSFSLHLL